MLPDNPYDSPQIAARKASPALLFWSVAAVFVTGILGGVMGGVLGGAVGAFVPDYYRTVFSHQDSAPFDPVSVGIGLGLTQGVVLGALVGLALVAMFYWYRLRIEKLDSESRQRP